MALLKIKVGGKAYMSTKITMHQTKEALKINRDALKMAKGAKDIKETDDIDLVESFMDETIDVNDRKVQMICDVYGNKFSPDDLENEFSIEEINTAFNDIISGASGTIEKN